MTSKRDIIKDIGLYAFGTYLTQAIDIVISVLMKRFLGPTFAGIWASLQVILIYAKYVNLGTTEATAREIPYVLGKKDTKRAEEIKDTVFWFALLGAVFAALGIAGFALLFRSTLSEPVFWGLVTIACLVILQRVYNYLVILLRAHKNFTLASQVMIFSSAVGAVPLLLLTWKFQIYGFFAATLLIYALNILFIQLHARFRFPWSLSWQKLKPLLSFGFTIMLLGAVDSVFRSIDRIIIPRFMGFEQMGYYALAIMAMNYLVTFPNMLHIVLFPHFQEKFSERDNVKDLLEYTRQATLGLAYLLPFLLGAVWIFSELLVDWILPQFRPGIFPLKILVVGAFFLCLNQQYMALLITIKKHLILIPLVAVLTASAAGISYLSIQAGYGLPGVAIVMSIHYFIYFMVYFRLGTRHLMSGWDSFQLLGRIVSMLIYFLAVLLALETLIPAPQSVLLRTSMRYGIFVLALLPFMFQLNRETGLWSHLGGIFWERIKKGRKEVVDDAGPV